MWPKPVSQFENRNVNKPITAKLFLSGSDEVRRIKIHSQITYESLIEKVYPLICKANHDCSINNEFEEEEFKEEEEGNSNDESSDNNDYSSNNEEEMRGNNNKYLQPFRKMINSHSFYWKDIDEDWIKFDTDEELSDALDYCIQSHGMKSEQLQFEKLIKIKVVCFKNENSKTKLSTKKQRNVKKKLRMEKKKLKEEEKKKKKIQDKKSKKKKEKKLNEKQQIKPSKDHVSMEEEKDNDDN
jgi:hypothetical protein